MKRLIIILSVILFASGSAFAIIQPTSASSEMPDLDVVDTAKFMNAVDFPDVRIEKQQNKLKKQQAKFEKKKRKLDEQIKAKQLEKENFINIHQIRLERNRQQLQELLEEQEKLK